MKFFLMNFAVFLFAVFLLAGAFKILANLGILIGVVLVFCGWHFIRYKWPGYF